ncbi:MAG: transglutaminase domain-containing protein [Bacteroidaceae bacterium]|nr:transglutaminase domain-containing protein [Bacteroidaceae bacterium]
MKKYFTLSLMLLAGLANLFAQNAQKGFDKKGVIAADFDMRRKAVDNEVYFKVFDKLEDARLQAMQFLYAYMPLPDIADYSAEYHLENVDYALKARREMPWGSSVPVREFLHFVLPVRVNNENLDCSRSAFYKELKERVENLSMREAVLEVNHWCHEKVTYTPSDIRTSSPLATVRTAYGRCGEESTFTVAALRAVGIPARQVYTPRWAHTDNNHAWVEAWVDGKWHFLGACEPEPVLDLAWFNAPASRGMLMHTNVFGRYDGPEEVLSVTPCYTEINVTANYAPVVTTDINVVDENGVPLKANVEFKIFNYAEFFTAAEKETDDKGRTSITTGYGDLVAWASAGDKFGFAKFTAGKERNVKIVVDKAPGYSATFGMDIVPPRERNTVPHVTSAQAAENARRFAYEDSVRNAYVATFITADEALEYARKLEFNDGHEKVVAQLLLKSRGNYKTIMKFLSGTPREERELAYYLLLSISDKDLRDVNIFVLLDHLISTVRNGAYDETFRKYILNPRVSNEMLTQYKGFFKKCFDADKRQYFAGDPQRWVKWCRDSIKVDATWNPLSLCMSPRGVWEMRTADPHSRDIFFVSAARAMGIPARIDEVTGKTQYMENNRWIDVDFDVVATGVKNAPQGTLTASYNPTRFIDNPRYYSHFSISKIVDGRLQLLGYPEEGVTWESLLKDGAALDAGDYLLMTGTRMADGSVLAHLTFLNVEDGKECNIEFVQRESSEQLQVIGDFNSENLFYDLAEERNRSLLSSTGRGYYIIAVIAPGSEPTNHFLRDVMPYKEDFEKWGQKMVLLFRDKDEAGRFVNDFPDLPSTVVWGTDINDKIYNEIVANMKLQNPNRPLILVADTFNRVVFISQGYSIGLGEQLVKVIKQLAE